MEKDPSARPASVAQLAQALPGGDPLEAAIAAGETPSPEMVAASGSKEGLKPVIAWGLLITIFVGWIAIIAINDRTRLHRLIPFENKPEILADRSKQFLDKIGINEKFEDSAYGFTINSKYLQNIAETRNESDPWKDLDEKAILFWHRLSPGKIDFTNGPTNVDLPLQFPGDALVVMDTKHNLIKFQYKPPSTPLPSETIGEPDWNTLFTEANLDISQWRKVDPEIIPPSYADIRQAWEGSLPNHPEKTVRIEAAALHGKPVSFEIMGQLPQSMPMNSISPTVIRTMSDPPVQKILIWRLLSLVFIVSGIIYLARRNIRLGRGDRRNAFRLAVFFLASGVLVWFLRLPHVSLVVLLLLFIQVGLIWIAYIAIEPYFRRKWPQILISWNRLLSGDWKDPLVARDVLIGAAIGALVHCFERFFDTYVTTWIGYADRLPPVAFVFESIMGIRLFVFTLFDTLSFSFYFIFLSICLLLLFNVLLRNHKFALFFSILFAGIPIGFLIGTGLPGYFVAFLLSASLFLVLIRFGFIAGLIIMFNLSFFGGFPITMDASAWYAPYGFTALAIFAAIVHYAFYNSLGGRPIFGTPRLDD